MNVYIVNLFKSLFTKDEILQVFRTFYLSFAGVFFAGISSVANAAVGGNWSTGKDALIALGSASLLAGLHAVDFYIKSHIANVKVAKQQDIKVTDINTNANK